ncbi:MAG TPA: DUF885 domain-containing protein [Candidatus Limnocylindrales bacterium]|nr:DUF885 domain-containing protein [Candidatus Limnocylindrales bacterium]
MHPLTESAAATLRRLAERFWEEVLEASPTWATVLGDRRFDDRLDDLSLAGRDRIEAARREVAAAARAIDPIALSPTDRLTRQMLIDEAEGQAASLAARTMDWTVDPIGGPQTGLQDLVDYQTISTPADGAALAARWRAIGPHVDAAIENLRRSAAEGRVAPRAPVERTLDILEHLEATPVESWKLASPAEAAHDDWPASELEAFREDVLTAVSEVAGPAFQRYRQVLRSEILPIARPNDRPGLVHIPGGLDAYRALIRVHTTLDLAPEAIHETGLREIERIDGEFIALGRRLLKTADLASTLASLRGDPALRFATAREVFATARRSLERATAAIPDWFGRLPRAACEVVAVPSHAEAHQTIAYYSWPAIDGSRPGRYYINLHQPTTRPRYEAEALAFHEAVPGHHLQIAIAQELDGLPAFQRNLGSTAFTEGWGLYAERLSDEMGLYSGALDRFGILSYDAWRAGRLVVDTGMHALGWTRDRAIQFLVEHTALGENNIENEVDRYIVWPGQALAYKIGQLEILRLRAMAKDRLGARFEIKGFHDAALGSGAVSLPTLGQIVDAWVADRSNDAAPTSGAIESPS